MVSNRQSAGLVDLTDEQLGQALGLRAAPRPQPSPVLQWFAVNPGLVTSPSAPEPPRGPLLLVTLPAGVESFLDARQATKAHASAQVEADFRRAQGKPDYQRAQVRQNAWDARHDAFARIADRYAFDDRAVEDRATLRAAQAVEAAHAATLDKIRALYPD